MTTTLMYRTPQLLIQDALGVERVEYDLALAWRQRAWWRGPRGRWSQGLPLESAWIRKFLWRPSPGILL